jgi:hypothetical protein
MGIERPGSRPVTDINPFDRSVGNSAEMRLASRASSRGIPASRRSLGDPGPTETGRAMEVAACRR